MRSMNTGPRKARGILLPLAGGIMLAAAFAPLRLWPLVFFAWVPLWTLIRRESALGGPHPWRRTFIQGWIMGTAAMIGILHWILALSNEEVTIPGLMIPSLALMASYIGLFFGLATLVARLLSRWSGLPFLAIVPVTTALAEFLRSLGPLGFPWGAPAYALAHVTPLLQISATIGFWGLVFLVLAVNALIASAIAVASTALAIRRPRGWVRLAGPILAGVLLIAWWVQGAAVLARHPAGQIEPGRSELRVLVAQPDIRREIKWKPEKAGEVVAITMRHAEAASSRGRAAGGFDLFVWPETVMPTRILDDLSLLSEVNSWIDREQKPVLLGTQEGYWGIDGGHQEWIAHNSALVLYPGGQHSEMYRKIRLVPFSERFPLQKLAPWLGRLDFGQSNFFPGDSLVVFDVNARGNSFRLGTLICFESVFPELARGYVARGANVLVNITNDFWFGRTAGPIQHADMAIHRAVENRIPLVRCANTGLSFTVDPWGRVSHQTGLFTRDDFVASVAAGAGSYAARHPDWACVALAAWLVVAAAGGVAGRARKSEGR